ncbi:hypothetical protein GCM10010495_78920 [Kitasatospora herbaricolor]|nr:hypothetical protein GCM10010495_78920 [Kitasatospora herbaricolor]
MKAPARRCSPTRAHRVDAYQGTAYDGRRAAPLQATVGRRRESAGTVAALLVSVAGTGRASHRAERLSPVA